jgi:hypothetical protein
VSSVLLLFQLQSLKFMCMFFSSWDLKRIRRQLYRPRSQTHQTPSKLFHKCAYLCISNSEFDRILQLPEDESAQDLNSGQSSPAHVWFLSSRSSNHALEVDEFGITKTVLLNSSAARDRVSSFSKAQVKFVIVVHLSPHCADGGLPPECPARLVLLLKVGLKVICEF